MKFKDSDLTQIFPPDVKPVRLGPYMCTAHPTLQEYFVEMEPDGTPILTRYWDGICWRYIHNNNVCIRQQFYWRGLNRDPKLIAKERGE